VARLATQQGGPISHEQLLKLGVKPGAIEYRLASSRLHSVFRGVYALGHEAITPRGTLIAALLACGDEAMVSHLSAAHWWGWWRTTPKDVDVTVPGRSRKGQDGINLHLVRTLDGRDVTTRDGVRITAPPRTLLDLAEVLSLQRLRLVIDEADRRGQFHANKLQELLERSPGRRGQKPLRTLLTDFETEPLLRSELEVLFKDLCDEHALPRPLTNVEVEGHEVDAFWPAQRLIVEVDSRAHHLNGAAFEKDRLRDAELLVAGYVVMRITYRQLKGDPGAVATRIRRLLLGA
jgi:hypothetical protein